MGIKEEKGRSRQQIWKLEEEIHKNYLTDNSPHLQSILQKITRFHKPRLGQTHLVVQLACPPTINFRDLQKKSQYVKPGLAKCVQCIQST